MKRNVLLKFSSRLSLLIQPLLPLSNFLLQHRSKSLLGCTQQRADNTHSRGEPTNHHNSMSQSWNGEDACKCASNTATELFPSSPFLRCMSLALLRVCTTTRPHNGSAPNFHPHMETHTRGTNSTGVNLFLVTAGQIRLGTSQFQFLPQLHLLSSHLGCLLSKFLQLPVRACTGNKEKILANEMGKRQRKHSHRRVSSHNNPAIRFSHRKR